MKPFLPGSWLDDGLTFSPCFAHHARYDRVDMLQVPSLKGIWDGGSQDPRNQAFCIVVPALWNSIPSEVHNAQPYLEGN